MDGPDNYDLATTDTLAYTSGYVLLQGKEGQEIMSEAILNVNHLRKSFGNMRS